MPTGLRIYFSNPTNKGVAFVIMGTLLFSSKAIIIKFLYALGINPLQMQTLRMLIVLPFYLVILILLVKRQGWGKLSNKDIAVSVFAGVACYHIASYLDLKGLLYISAGLERVILFCYPAIGILFGWLFLKESVTFKLLAALASTYLGIILFFYADLRVGGDDVLFGAALVFIASILTAGFMIANQTYSRKLGSQRFTCIAMLGACVTLLIHANLAQVGDLTQFSTNMYIGVSVMAIMCTLIPTFLLSAGVKEIGASRASIIGAIGPLFTVLVSSYLLDEPLGWMHVVGLLLVLVGMRLLKK